MLSHPAKGATIVDGELFYDLQFMGDDNQCLDEEVDNAKLMCENCSRIVHFTQIFYVNKHDKYLCEICHPYLENDHDAERLCNYIEDNAETLSQEI